MLLTGDLCLRLDGELDSGGVVLFRVRFRALGGVLVDDVVGVLSGGVLTDGVDTGGHVDVEAGGSDCGALDGGADADGSCCGVVATFVSWLFTASPVA